MQGIWSDLRQTWVDGLSDSAAGNEQGTPAVNPALEDEIRVSGPASQVKVAVIPQISPVETCASGDLMAAAERLPVAQAPSWLQDPTTGIVLSPIDESFDLSYHRP